MGIPWVAAPHHGETRRCISLPFLISFIANIARKRPKLNRDKTTPRKKPGRKARGIKLGWSIPERASEQRQAAKKGAAVNKALALAHAENVLPMIEQIRAGGASLRQIATELNARGIKTARGGKWHATTVRNIITAENGAAVRAA